MIGRIASVRALSAHIRELFASDSHLTNLWVEGEVTEVKTWSSGHTYFNLKEDNVQLQCVLFKREAARQRFLPAHGARFALHGKIEVYESRSCYQLIVDLVQPAGLGLYALELEQLRQKLELEGLFELSRKRPLPVFPIAIGVVTSADGAVWHDIQNVLRRRYPLVELILSPSLVQGASAPASLISALQLLQDDGRAEVIIIGRGGGSAEDLAAFNDEALARAVFACRVPVISAVGHESDWTIIDDVADLRAPTPSAAAELASPSIDELGLAVTMLDDRLERAATSALQLAQQQLDLVTMRLRRWIPEQHRQARRDQIESLRHRLLLAANRPLPGYRHRIGSSKAIIASRTEFNLARRRLVVERQRQLLAALDVNAVLNRGFSMLTRPGSQTPIREAGDVEIGAQLQGYMSDGVIDLKVESTRPNLGRLG